MQPTKRKFQDPRLSLESAKMLQYRAALEQKLEQKTVIGFVSKKKFRKTDIGKLETIYDFDDDVVQLKGATRDNVTLSRTLSGIIPAKKRKGVSGDVDLPARDDLGERRWKHELRGLSRVGIVSNGGRLENELEGLHGGRDDVEDSVEVDGSDDDFYNTIKRRRDLKLRMKAEKFSRIPQDISPADITVDGKRNISAPMLKNRGLTRNRMKQNPRVSNKVRYEKAKKCRQGQVYEIRKQTGPYEWEKTGINARVTRSIRFK